jgi:hypothetical protein
MKRFLECLWEAIAAILLILFLALLVIPPGLCCHCNRLFN